MTHNDHINDQRDDRRNYGHHDGHLYGIRKWDIEMHLF